VPYREPEPHEPKRATPVYFDGPIAWEDPGLPWLRRLVNTLGATFLPAETARSVAEGPLGPALWFALLTALPCAPLWTVLPFTHTLRFLPSFGLEVLPQPGLSIGGDVARAMGIGLALSLVSMFSWALPFASLLKAFASEAHAAQAARAAWRTALYRVWIIPLGMTLFYLATWGFPDKPPALAFDITVLCFQLLPRILIVVHCHAMAKFLGASGGSALLVALVPLGVEAAAGLWVSDLARHLLPPMEAALSAVGG
jgi:hypothetical protein